MFKKSLLFLSFLISTNSYAGRWTDWGVSVNEIYVHGAGKINIAKTSICNPDSCSSGTLFYVLLSTNAAFDEIYSAVLTAEISDMDVNIYLSGCSSNYPLITHFRVRTK